MENGEKDEELPYPNPKVYMGTARGKERAKRRRTKFKALRISEGYIITFSKSLINLLYYIFYCAIIAVYQGYSTSEISIVLTCFV
ncbi:MAG: hypothetical protein IKL42_02435, partial [Clostridia bacterium]|nr:hypothetical protein [Clostridia bacterium]